MIVVLCFRFLVQTIKSSPATEKDAGEGTGTKADDSKSDDMQPPPAKRVRRRGQNKSRPRPAFIPFSEMLCPSCYHGDGSGSTCKFGEKCRYTHDIAKYMSSKPPDISNECYLFKMYGKCPYGRACRFAKSHLSDDFESIVDESLYDPGRPERTLNVISRSLQEKLRKRQLIFTRSEAYLKRLKEIKKELSEGTGKLSSTSEMNLEDQELRTKTGDMDGGVKTDDIENCLKKEEEKNDGQVDEKESSVQDCGGGSSVHVQTCGPLTDEDIVKLKPAEKKKVCENRA